MCQYSDNESINCWNYILVNLSNNKRPIGLNGHMSTIAHTHTCRGVSYMHLIMFYSWVSGVEKL